MKSAGNSFDKHRVGGVELLVTHSYHTAFKRLIPLGISTAERNRTHTSAKILLICQNALY